MIRSFTGWRYIFAVAIFMHHYQIDGKSVLQAGGAIGVTFFFILSGFLLAYGYKKRLMTREISTSDFYKARAVKLYPLHILCFAAVFLLGIRNFVTADLPKAVLNLFLLQSWVPSPDYYMSYNAVSWFLSDELFFYLMFPFVLPVLLNGSGKKIAVGAGIFAISYSAAAALIPLDHYHAYFYINPLSRFADFVFGILVFRIFDQRRQATVGHTSRAEAGAILLVFATFILFDHIPKPYHYCSVIFWGPVAMLIYTFANTSLSVNYPPPHAKYTTYCTNLWGPTKNAHAVTNRTGRHLFARIVLSRHTIVRRSQFLFLSDSSTSHSVRTYPCRQGRSRHGQPAGPTRLSRAYHARQCGLPEMDRAARIPVVETQNNIMPC